MQMDRNYPDIEHHSDVEQYDINRNVVFSDVLKINPVCIINGVSYSYMNANNGYVTHKIKGFIDIDVESYIYDRIWFSMRDKSFEMSFVSSKRVVIDTGICLSLDDLYNRRFHK